MSLDSLSPEPRGERSWRVVEGQTLKWRCWAGDYAVFNPLSGQTHFLDIATGQILTQLAAGPRKVDQVCLSVSSFLEIPNDNTVAATIAEVLIRLEDLGLVEHFD